MVSRGACPGPFIRQFVHQLRHRAFTPPSCAPSIEGGERQRMYANLYYSFCLMPRRLMRA